MEVKSESCFEAGGAGFVSREFEVPAEGWRSGEVPVFPVSPGEWAALDWEGLNRMPDPSAHGRMLVHRFVEALRGQVAALGVGRDHVGAAELALSCPLTDSRGEPLLLGLAEVYSRLALAGGMAGQARCQAAPPHLHDMPVSPGVAMPDGVRRAELLRFMTWAAVWGGQDEWGEGRGEALVDRYLQERP